MIKINKINTIKQMNIFFIIVFIFTTITNAAVKTHTNKLQIKQTKINKKEENHHRHNK